MPVQHATMSKIEAYLNENFTFPPTLSSRITKIEYASEQFLWLKREDELGPIAIGSKNRKIEVLRSYCSKHQIEKLLIEGSQYSNFVLAALILCKELQMDYHLFLHHDKRKAPKGQAFWIQELAAEDKISYLPFGAAKAAMKKHQKTSPLKCFLVEEGFKQLEGFWAGCHLGLELATQISPETDALFFDAGTGVTAMGALFALWPQIDTNNLAAQVHLIAGDADSFQKDFTHLATLASRELGLAEKGNMPEIHFSFPPTAKSFGAVNSTTKAFLLEIFHKYGILLDPIYGVKHLMTTFQTLSVQNYQKPLCVLNTGPFGLQGFY